MVRGRWRGRRPGPGPAPGPRARDDGPGPHRRPSTGEDRVVHAGQHPDVLRQVGARGDRRVADHVHLPRLHRCGRRRATRCNASPNGREAVCCSSHHADSANSRSADAGGAAHDADPGHAHADPGAAGGTLVRRLRGALRARDVARAAGMFAATSFWRDLVSFTWNITTVENPAGVAELLERDPRPHRPDGLRRRGAARRGRRRHHRLVHLRDRRRSGARPRAAGRGGRRAQGVDVPDDALRAEGIRGAARAGPADGGRARRRTRSA